MFEKNIEKIFNIDFICLFAERAEEFKGSINLRIPAVIFTMKEKEQVLDYFSLVELEVHDENTLIPYDVERRNNKLYTKKLISIDESKELIASKISIYKDLFHKGADLNPRNLIFVVTEDIDDNFVKINPDERIFKRAKDPWIRKEFKDVIIEKDFIFHVIKSTELVKFGIYDYYSVFLPISKEDLSYNYKELPKKAKNFYDKINKIYLKNKKETTKNKSLMENLDRWGKLINKRQKSKIKVVYNNSGSILNSAVVQGDFLITGDLSFYETNNLDEAFYLSAILNSPLMTSQIRIRKSSRHIFKLPFEIDIRKFNPDSENHKKLAEFGSKAHEHSKSVIKKMLEEENSQNISKNKIQTQISKKIDDLLKEIDQILIDEFKFISKNII